MKAKNIYTAVLIVIGGCFMFNEKRLYARADSGEPRRILLLGASVGRKWNLPEWPARTNKTGYIVEMATCYQFDKSEVLEEILMRPKRKFRLTRTYLKGFFKPKQKKPDVLFIKECAAYFPRDVEKDTAVIKQWINQCRAAGISPALTTVVPVTKAHSAQKPERLHRILEYNDRIKELAEKENIPCLDLEKALRVSNEDRSLREELTSGDGLHLNEEAYEILDKELDKTLEAIFGEL